MKTIPEIATLLGVQPQTIHKAKKRLETQTGEALQPFQDDTDKRKFLYSDDQVELLKQHINFDLVAQRNEKDQPQVSHRCDIVYAPQDNRCDTSTLGKVTIEDGNHSAMAIIDAIPENYSLEVFRTNETRLSLANPENLLGNLQAVLGGLTSAMDQYSERQNEELKRIREANRIADLELQKFRSHQQEFQMKTHVATLLQNDEIQSFQTKLSEINAMGGSGNV